MIARDPYAWPRPSEPRAVQDTHRNAEFGRAGKCEGLASEFVGDFVHAPSLPMRAAPKFRYPQASAPYASTVTKPTESGRRSVGLVTLGVAVSRIRPQASDVIQDVCRLA